MSKMLTHEQIYEIKLHLLSGRHVEDVYQDFKGLGISRTDVIDISNRNVQRPPRTRTTWGGAQTEMQFSEQEVK